MDYWMIIELAAPSHFSLSHGLSVLVEDFWFRTILVVQRRVSVIFLSVKSLTPSRLLHVLLNVLLLVEFLITPIGVLINGRATQTTEVLDRLLRNLRLLLFQMLKLSLLVVSQNGGVFHSCELCKLRFLSDQQLGTLVGVVRVTHAPESLGSFVVLQLRRLTIGD
jgi:hypothetical protein